MRWCPDSKPSRNCCTARFSSWHDRLPVSNLGNRRRIFMWTSLFTNLMGYDDEKKCYGGGAKWLSTSPGKRWTEKYFLWYSVVWISWFGCIVLTQAYEEWEYMYVGLLMALPCFLGPLLLFPGQGEPSTPIWNRYFIHANVWIAILSFVGNYFWTHYFYNLLGASYTFPAHRINDVPIAMFLCTHAYFCTYHTATTIVLRRFYTSACYQRLNRATQCLATCTLIVSMAYATAFMETWSISSFPYWTFQNRSLMYSVGSMCYALYFIVTFPMYYQLGEKASSTTPRSVVETVFNSLGACMLVTILLDLWRLLIGGIVPNVPTCVPFL